MILCYISIDNFIYIYIYIFVIYIYVYICIFMHIFSNTIIWRVLNLIIWWFFNLITDSHSRSDIALRCNEGPGRCVGSSRRGTPRWCTESYSRWRTSSSACRCCFVSPWRRSNISHCAGASALPRRRPGAQALYIDKK